MKKSSIPAVITLSAGAVACITCILNHYPILDTLLAVFITLLIFYIIGLVVSKYINKINKDANDAYILAERERMKAEKQNQEETEADKETGGESDSEMGTNEEVK
ncbi:MAG: hypothetical protein PUC65_09180 [Clostridiales bacterium]|nr:hypothetical protein [Clostridiales bacterium]